MRRCKTLLSFVFTLITGSNIFSQTTMPLRGPLLPQLDTLASATDSATDRARYISTLMTLAGGAKLREPFASTFSKRFMLDEERVRKGKQSLVSELAVSMAFNRLAEVIKSPARVDVDAVHHLRTALASQAPHLITLKASPAGCNPGEAIFLIYLLVANDGSVTGTPLQLPEGTELPTVQLTATTGQQKSMSFLLSDFVNSHSQMDVLTQVEQVLSLLTL